MTTATGRVRIEGTAALGQIERATSRLRTSFRKLDKEATKAGKTVRDMSATLRGPLAAGAAAGVAALGALVDHTLQTRLEIANLATQTGVSAQLFGTLKLAADRTGASAKQVSGALKALTARAGQAAAGNEQLRKEFEDLKVEYEDGSGQLRDVEDIFRDLVSALGDVENETNRAATAERLMGQAAYGLRQALGELSEDGLNRAEQAARGFTSHLTEEGIKAAADYEIATFKLQTALKSLGDLASNNVGPALNGIIDPLVYLSVLVADFTNQTIKNAVGTLKVFVDALSFTGRAIVAVANKDLKAFGEAAKGFQTSLEDLAENAGVPSLEKAARRAEEVTKAFRIASGETLALGDAAKQTGSDFEETFTAAGLVDPLTGEILQAASAIDTVKDSAKEAEQPIEKIREALEEVSEAAAPANFPNPFFDFGVAASLQNEAINEAIDSLEAYAFLQELAAEREAAAIEKSIEANERARENREAAAQTFLNLSDLVQRVTGDIVAQAEASENLSEEQRQNALRAFAVEKAASLASAIVNTAVGVTQALAAAPPPLNLINAALVGAAGGLSIAEIAAQQPSFALGGIMPTTGATATLHPGEGVLSAGAVDRMGGASALAASNARSGLQGGGTVVNVQWKHLRTSFNYEARDGRSRPGPLRDIRRDGRRAGQRRRKQYEDHGAL